MRINTNVNALVAYRNLSGINSAVSDSMSKLSTGFRINRAADDAAGLGIANKLRAENRALGQASRNAEQANSVLQIAEGATSSVQKALERMKELATQAGSDSVDNEGRLRIDSEFNALRAEITRTVDTTKFQGNALLDGTFGSLPAQLEAADVTVGAAATAGTYSITATDAGVITLNRGTTAVGSVDLANAANNTSSATSAFAAGVLTFNFGSGTGAISLAVDATSATDAASVAEALNGKGFAITGAVDGTDVAPAAQTLTGSAVVADYSGTNATFDIAVDGASAQTITLSGNYVAAAPAAVTSAATATAADRSTTNVSFDVSIDGGTASTITLSGNHGSVGDMVTEINTALSTAGITTLTVAEGTAGDAGKLVWTSTATGADTSFEITDTDSVLGGAISETSGTGGLSAMITAINTGLSSASITTVSVAEGTGADAGKLVWSHSGTGSTASFAVTDTTSALGGSFTVVEGDDAITDALLTANSITGNSESRVAKFLVGASGAYQTDDTITLAAMDLSITALGLDTASLATADSARTALTSIDSAMSTLNSTLGDIGANQNRLENTMSNLKTTILNFTAAESVVRDLDMAEEMMKFSKNNILAQAATSMLAQANASSQGILQLLRG